MSSLDTSNGVYLNSPPVVKLLPVIMVLQPSLQQLGTLELHLQCSCVMWKPMPVQLDQPVVVEAVNWVGEPKPAADTCHDLGFGEFGHAP